MAADADSYPPTPRTTPTRNRDRAHYDTERVHAILDSEFLCHVGFDDDAGPVVLPTLYARDGGRLYLHGSSGSRLMRRAVAGTALCVTVTHLDGIVLARSAFHHSVNYRSVVALGTGWTVTDPEEKRRALDLIVDCVVAGRSADTRGATDKELAATGVLRMELREVSAKMRTGGVNDDAEDLALPHWAGVVPVRRTYAPPEPDPRLGAEVELPAYLNRYDAVL